jgi:hypothetical protein
MPGQGEFGYVTPRLGTGKSLTFFHSVLYCRTEALKVQR